MFSISKNVKEELKVQLFENKSLGKYLDLDELSLEIRMYIMSNFVAYTGHLY